MSDNIQIVQQCYAEFGKGNIPGLLDLLSEDIRWAEPYHPEIPFSGVRNGKTEVAEFFTQIGTTMTFTQFEPQHFYGDGNAVIVKGMFAGTVNENGHPFESEWVMLWEVVDGKATSFQSYSDTLAFAKALQD